MANSGRTDLLAAYGGKLTLTATGDFAIVQDSLDSPDASIQWIQHFIQTNPRLPDGNGGFLTRPDDLFNPDWGGGEGTFVGEMITPDLIGAWQARIISGLRQNPYLAQTPAPTVVITDLGNGLVQIDISCYAVTGQLVTVPSQQLRVY